MTGRRNGRPRKAFHCPGCHAVLAFIRPEWLVGKMLLTTDAAVSAHRENGIVTIHCQCGRITTLRWAMFQF